MGPGQETGAGSPEGCFQVKRAYGLTVDRREAAALERILQGCASTAMDPMVCRAAPAPAGDTGRGAGGDDVLARYDDNRNGRITCKEARPARDRTRPPVAPRVPVHARW